MIRRITVSVGRGRLASGLAACRIALSRRRGTNANVVRSADTRVGAVRPPIGVRRCTTARRTRAPGVAALVPNAMTRPTHRDTLSVESDAPAGRRADHFTAAVLDASRVGSPASDSSVPGLSTRLIVGLGISNPGQKQQAQAQDDRRKWSHLDLSISSLPGPARSADAALRGSRPWPGSVTSKEMLPALRRAIVPESSANEPNPTPAVARVGSWPQAAVADARRNLNQPRSRPGGGRNRCRGSAGSPRW